MNNDERIVITRESIYEELNKKDSIILTIVIIVVSFVVMYLVLGLLPSNMKIAFRVYLIVSSIVGVIVVIRRSLMLKDGKYKIIEDKIVLVEDKRFDIEAYLFRLGHRYKVTFKDFGTTVISKQDLGRYTLGDKYCFVVFKPFFKKDVILCYNLNKYNYIKK